MAEKEPVYGKRFGNDQSGCKATAIAKRVPPKRRPALPSYGDNCFAVMVFEGRPFYGTGLMMVEGTPPPEALVSRPDVGPRFLRLVTLTPDTGCVPVAFGRFWNRGVEGPVVIFADGVMLPEDQYEIIRRRWPSATFHFVDRDPLIIVIRAGSEIVAMAGPIPKSKASAAAGKYFAARAGSEDRP
jgi:hypothetical protein